jgi:hypothetical protein
MSKIIMTTIKPLRYNGRAQQNSEASHSSISLVRRFDSHSPHACSGAILRRAAAAPLFSPITRTCTNHNHYIQPIAKDATALCNDSARVMYHVFVVTTMLRDGVAMALLERGLEVTAETANETSDGVGKKDAI